MRSTVLLLLVPTVLIGSLASAQAKSSPLQSPGQASSPSTTPSSLALRDPNAIAILQGTLIALTGSGAFSTPGSLAASGTYTKVATRSPGFYPIRVKVLGTNLVRREVDMTEGTHIVVTRGRSGWSGSPAGVKVLSVSQLAGNGLEDLPVLALASWLGSSTCDIALREDVTISGTLAHHLDVRERHVGDHPAYAEVAHWELFVDAATNLPLRVRYFQHPVDWRVGVPIDLDFSDFRHVHGILFPFTITRLISEEKTAVVQYHAIDIDVAVRSEEFQPR